MMFVTAAIAPFGPIRSAQVCAAFAIGSKGSAREGAFDVIRRRYQAVTTVRIVGDPTVGYPALMTQVEDGTDIAAGRARWQRRFDAAQQAGRVRDTDFTTLSGVEVQP